LIKVKLAQEKLPVATPSPTPTSAKPAEQVMKGASIKCIKGKKSVKPIKGKCPKGFKKGS
jgi:hypothetical protein